MAIREVDLGKVRGDINDSQAIFTQASTRSNIASGETGSTIFGKIKKWFADLGAAAFCSVVNNATTTAANTVLDGRMGKTLQNGIDSLNSNLSQGGVDNDVGYSKFPDGTYIQWGFFGGTAMTNSNKNATRQVTFRENFAGTAPVSVLITPANANYLNGYCVDNIAATGCRVILMGALAANTTYDSGFRWLAIGRWK